MALYNFRFFGKDIWHLQSLPNDELEAAYPHRRRVFCLGRGKRLLSKEVRNSQEPLHFVTLKVTIPSSFLLCCPHRHKRSDFMKQLTLVIGSLFLASACTTIDPETGQEVRNSTATGAIIGAATGAILGKATGSHHKDRAFVGAAIGAIAGAAVGSYMDKQEATMRREMAGTGVDVIRDGDRLLLNIPNRVTFDVNKANVKPEFTTVLNKIASVVNHYPKTMIEVAGHTDSTGSASYNQSLSENRAKSVKSYLNQQGVMYQRVTAIGFGETRPVANNATASGRAQNRRVEIELVPIVQGRS